MQLRQLEISVHEQLLSIRSIYNLVHSSNFARAYAGTDDKSEILDAIKKLDIDFIKKWIKDFYKKDLESLGMIQLRHIASALKIKNYSRRNKWQLIKDIRSKFPNKIFKVGEEVIDGHFVIIIKDIVRDFEGYIKTINGKPADDMYHSNTGEKIVRRP